MRRLPRKSPLFPYTTLFRSIHAGDVRDVRGERDPARRGRSQQPEPPRDHGPQAVGPHHDPRGGSGDRKSTRLNSSHTVISYAVFCLKKKILIVSLMV